SPTPIAQTPTTSITYTVSVKDANSCVTQVPTELYVIPPLVDIKYDTTIIVGDTIHLPISNKGGSVKFTWTPTDGLSCLQCTRPTVHPLNDIIYNVHMEDIKKCTTADGVFSIHVKPLTFIKVPTTFTPNGDGNNDIIYVKGWGIKDLISFQIYNRWGELVFETSELSEGWNGYYKDVLQNNDVYTYKVVALDYFDKQQELQGHINLMR
ncbi:MAG TPA: T9SS type B sorting domain-containing protein, partial [Bacteroidia bacterium]|nr:T9SS type B sorting domain-containing protein [Bacteroidia bacterium]